MCRRQRLNRRIVLIADSRPGLGERKRNALAEGRNREPSEGRTVGTEEDARQDGQGSQPE
jgi:hypothetical protein